MMNLFLGCFFFVEINYGKPFCFVFVGRCRVVAAADAFNRSLVLGHNSTSFFHEDGSRLQTWWPIRIGVSSRVMVMGSSLTLYLTANGALELQ